MLDQDLTITALQNLQQAYTDLREFFRARGVENFDNDVCRRNLMMSTFHEHYFTKAFAEQFGEARNDGRTGEADIIITSLDREVECKLTTVTPSGGFNMQTDYKTLQAKGSLDYLYVLTNREFTEFAVLYFDGLTTDDFHPPARSSRGKARMAKHAGFSKCRVLFGEVEDRTAANLESAKRKLAECSERAVKTRAKLEKAIEHWEEANASYTIRTEPVPFTQAQMRLAS